MILKQGVEVWNKWREENPAVRPDLSDKAFINKHFDKINLAYSDLNHVYFETCFLPEAILSGADIGRMEILESVLHFAQLDNITRAPYSIKGSDLRFSKCKNSNFSNCIISAVTFNHANLMNSSFLNADIENTSFDSCNLDNADFSDSAIGYSNFSSVNLKAVKGLSSVRHFGPSSVSLDTIYNSSGTIPDHFLRGCGVPEDFITLIPSLTIEPFQFYKCFISHSTKDHLFCDRLYADLQSKGVRCWYFPEDARWGRSVWGEIDKPIKTYDKLILVCSKQSLNSPVVLRELERALQREDAEGKHILFPIRIDNYLLGKNGWDHPRKADVIAKVAGDFRNWKDPIAYKKALDRLLRDLKASEE